MNNYEIDNLDLNILKFLQNDARMAFTEIAKKLDVSGGTIHQRIEKLRSAGIIEKSQFVLNHKLLGYGLNVLIGIHLKDAKSIEVVIEKLKGFPEITEAYFTTGNYALFIKATLKDIDDYHHFLVHKIQSISLIRATESFICLKKLIDRDLLIQSTK